MRMFRIRVLLTQTGWSGCRLPRTPLGSLWPSSLPPLQALSWSLPWNHTYMYNIKYQNQYLMYIIYCPGIIDRMSLLDSILHGHCPWIIHIFNISHNETVSRVILLLNKILTTDLMALFEKKTTFKTLFNR